MWPFRVRWVEEVVGEPNQVVIDYVIHVMMRVNSQSKAELTKGA